MTVTTNNEIRDYGHFIDGKEIAAAASIDRRGPSVGTLVARFADGSEDDAAAAVRAARLAFDEGPWPQLSGPERSRILLRCAAAIEDNAEALARIDALEVGKPIRQARDDIGTAVALFEYAAAMAHEIHGETYTNLENGRFGLVLREPVGVAGLIVPWNFPAAIFAQKVPYALAAGCTVVAKPSEFTSGSAVEIAKLMADAGLPSGVVNVVTGQGGVVGRFLVESRDVDFISFTGSTATGERIATAAAATHKRVSLELGGKGANVVFADADLDDAVDGTLFTVFYATGECCCAGTRLLVEDSVADEFLNRLVRRAEELRVGGPDDDSAELGALIHEDHVDGVLEYIAAGSAEGARLLTGGSRIGGELAEGCFLEPTIFDGVEPGMRIFDEEIFGPVLSAVRFTGLEQAVELANLTPYGLGSSVWTKNLDTALRMTQRLRAGTVWVNTALDTAPQMPFGGVGDSGHGREMGRAGLEEFQELKSCFIHLGKRAPYFDTDAASG
jgi:betaine-aldehyde dehydrogenase